MKIKNILCILLCLLFMGTTVWAAVTENVPQETQSEWNPPQNDAAEQPENMPENGMDRGMRRGGRGFGRGMRPEDGENTAEGETMQPPQDWQGNPGRGPGFDGMEPQEQQPLQDSQSQAQETKDRYTFTYIASAVLLLIGFVFVKFYKRRTF